MALTQFDCGAKDDAHPHACINTQERPGLLNLLKVLFVMIQLLLRISALIDGGSSSRIDDQLANIFD